jgi:zinc protease
MSPLFPALLPRWDESLQAADRCDELCLVLAILLPHAGPKIERWQTTAGARVLLSRTMRLPIVDIQVDLPPARLMKGGQAGVASLTRELLELGVAGMDETQIASRMADLGARLSGGVDRDRASIALRTLSMADKRGPWLRLLRAILSTPQFPAAFSSARRHVPWLPSRKR